MINLRSRPRSLCRGAIAAILCAALAPGAGAADRNAQRDEPDAQADPAAKRAPDAQFGFVDAGWQAGISEKQAAPKKRPQRSQSGKAPMKLLFEKSAFPLSGTTLAYREYPMTGRHVVTGTQDEGFDIGLFGWNTELLAQGEPADWTWFQPGVSSAEWNSNRKNEHLRIFNESVYAMNGGTVVACWRNAADNPHPQNEGETAKDDKCENAGWINPKLCSGEMAGAGNMVWIKEKTGAYALYAHLKAGSVSKKLCPHDEQYFSTPISGEQAAPNFPPEAVVVNGASVVKGEFLGRAGNSGASGGPHVHVHKEIGGNPFPIIFENGLSSPWKWPDDVKNANAGVKWSSFAGQKLPTTGVAGESTLAWPVRSASVPFNRSDVWAPLYQGHFDHLSQSGLWPGLVTCKVSQGAVYYEFIDWTAAPAGAKWYGKHGLTDIQRDQEIADAQANGYALTSSYTCSGNSVVIFKK